MPEYNHPAERKQNGEQDTDDRTPAEVFGREGDTVPVSVVSAAQATDSRSDSSRTVRPRRGYGEGKYGASGFGGSRPLADTQAVEVRHPRQAVPVGEDAEVVGSHFNEQRDAWEVVVTRPR